MSEEQRQWLRYQSKFLFDHPSCSRCRDDFQVFTPSSHIWHLEQPLHVHDIYQPDNHFSVCTPCYAALSRSRIAMATTYDSKRHFLMIDRSMHHGSASNSDDNRY